MKYIKYLFSLYRELKKQDKKGFTPTFDKKYNTDKQLLIGIYKLAETLIDKSFKPSAPLNWNKERWYKMCKKSNAAKLLIIAAWAVKEIIRQTKC